MRKEETRNGEKKEKKRKDEEKRDEPADGALREGADAGQTQVGQGLADVGLGDAEFDAALLEALGEGLQLARVRLCFDTDIKSHTDSHHQSMKHVGSSTVCPTESASDSVLSDSCQTDVGWVFCQSRPAWKTYR